ncbi:MAG: hypothetical protein KJ709_00335 [Nanoarchaeota archaeon]|nr:hypothetical protein [Nanoarchaeota archaeon]
MDLDISHTATIYIWEGAQPFDIDDVLFPLGGMVTPALGELQATGLIRRPLYCSPTLRIYPVTKEMEEEHRRQGELEKAYKRSGFATPILEERLAKYGLPVPDHEITFVPRYENKGVELKQIAAVAVHLDIDIHRGMKVLAVPGTSLEKDWLYASEEIADKLGMTVPSEVFTTPSAPQ